MSRTSLVRVALLLFAVGCSSGGSNDEGVAGSNGSAGQGGQSGPAGSGGVAGTPGQAGSGPAGSIGTAGSGPAGSGGGPTGVAGGSARGGTGGGASGGSGPAGSGPGGGAGGASAGSGGSVAGRGGGAGGTAGTGAAGTTGGGRPYTCPAGPFTSPTSSTLTPMRVTGVPPFDSFNNDGNNFGNIEGPVWLESEGALFLSEIGGGNNPPPARVLKITPTGTVSIAIPDAGSNGLAVDGMGRLISANHKTGSLSVLSLTGGAATPIVSTYMNARFDSPNDLAIRSDGTIYFTDPDYQAPSSRPQGKTRVYKVAPGASTATVIDENRQQPNGITLSLDENTLFVATGAGMFKYTIDPGTGAVGAGTQFLNSGGTNVSSGDGMTMDCAGNLYIAANANSQLLVVSPAGSDHRDGVTAGDHQRRLRRDRPQDPVSDRAGHRQERADGPVQDRDAAAGHAVLRAVVVSNLPKRTSVPWPSGKARVCKTLIPRFKSGRHLHKTSLGFAPLRCPSFKGV